MRTYWLAYIFDDGKSNITSMLASDSDDAISFLSIGLNKIYKTDKFKIICCVSNYETAAERLLSYDG